MVDSDSGLAVSDEEILTAFAELDESPLYVWEVAEEVPADEGELADAFDDLEERGLLESDTDYAPGTVWRLDPDADLDDDASATDGVTGGDVGDDERTETDVEAQATGTGSQGTPRDQETGDAQPVDEPGEEAANPPYRLPTDAIERFDPPGTPEQKARRREALRHAYGYLREEGAADREEFVAEVYSSYRGAYESPDDGWWGEVIEPGFERLPGAERADGDDRWTFVGAADGQSF